MSGVRSLVWKVLLGCLSAHRRFESFVLCRVVGTVVLRYWVVACTLRRAMW